MKVRRCHVGRRRRESRSRRGTLARHLAYVPERGVGVHGDGAQGSRRLAARAESRVFASHRRDTVDDLITQMSSGSAALRPRCQLDASARVLGWPPAHGAGPGPAQRRPGLRCGAGDGRQQAQRRARQRDSHATSVPKWASDRSLWASPPRDSPTDTDRGLRSIPGTPESSAHSANDGDPGAAARPSGRDQVRGGNSPTARTLYPQRAACTPTTGCACTTRCCAPLGRGQEVDRSYAVIAGATSPAGNNSTGSTSPISWARHLKNHGMPVLRRLLAPPVHAVGVANPAPGHKPDDPRHMVTLGQSERSPRRFSRRSRSTSPSTATPRATIHTSAVGCHGHPGGLSQTGFRDGGESQAGQGADLVRDA